MEEQTDKQSESGSRIECPSCGFHIAKFQMELRFAPTYTCPRCGNDASSDGEPARI